MLCSVKCCTTALFNPETSILIQKRHPYTGNLNSETSGDSKNTFLHCGDVLDLREPDLEHILLGAFEVLEPPLIHSAVHTSRDKLGVIGQPRQAPHLSIMPPVLKSL